MANKSGWDNVLGQVKKINTSVPVWQYLRFSPDGKDEPANMNKAMYTICLKKVVARG